MQQLIDGHPVELDIIGEGLPVLMLHGFPLDRRALRRSVDPVFEGRTGYRRIHVDLPGFGASPRVPGHRRKRRDGGVRAAADRRGRRRRPAPPRRRILGGVPGTGRDRPCVRCRSPERRCSSRWSSLAFADRDLPPHRLLYEEPGVLAGAPDAHAAAIREIGTVIDGPAWSYFSAVIAPTFGAGDAEAIAAIAHGYGFPTDVDAAAEPYEGPTLIVTGRQDSVVGYRDALTMLERFPRATYAVLDAASHNVSGERPALLAALVDDWLDRVERSRA